MSSIFIEKLPSNLASSIQAQYDLMYPIFSKYANSEGNTYYTHVKLNYEFSCFLLETALFYKNAIVPMSKGSKAFMNLGNDSIRTVKIGNHILTDVERRKILGIEREFNSILNKYNIPISLLLFSDVKDFARSLNGYFETQQYA